MRRPQGVTLSPRLPASPVTLERGKQRPPEARERVDAPDAQGVAFAALGVLGQFRLRFGGEGIVIHRCCSTRYEVIVEDLAELSFGEVRGGVERCVKVLQAGGEQRYVEHLGLRKPHVQAQVGYRQSVIGFDQLLPPGRTSLSLGEFDAEPRYGRIRVIGEQSYQ